MCLYFFTIPSNGYPRLVCDSLLSKSVFIYSFVAKDKSQFLITLFKVLNLSYGKGHAL